MSRPANAAILIPLDVSAAMISAGTSVPVVDALQGEVAWSSATAYSGSETKINHQGWLYAAVAASTNVTPGADPAKWRRTGPSNRMAPFDDQINTQAKANGSITYVLRPGFFTGVALYGLQGERLYVQLYEAPGGALVEESSYSGDLYEQAAGLFEYLFMPLRPLTKWHRQDLPLYPNAELHITVSSTADKPVAVGHIVVGNWGTLLGSGDFGGVEYGAGAEIKTYSYIKTNDDGTVTIVPRFSATNISCSVVIDAEQANAAHDLLRQVSSRPVAFIASGLPRYDYLNTFGLVSSAVSADSYGIATINLKVQGYT